MKKILSLLLAALMLLSLCACGKGNSDGEAAPAPVPSKLLVGFSKVCITPKDPVILSGYSSNRLSTSVKDDIYLMCLAMKSGDETALLFIQDLEFSTANVTPTVRKEVGAALDIPQSSIFMAATGNYSAPNLKSEHENNVAYLEFYMDAVMQAATEAMDDLAPTTLYKTTTETEGLNFVHHYKMVDGTVEDGYYGFFDREIEGHVIEADETMRLVKLQRDGKSPILLVNWQVRPDMAYRENKTQISADFIGYMRNKIEAETGMHVAYFTGAFGDLSAFSKIESENHGLDVQAYGEKLADYAIAALGNMELLGGETIGSFTSMYKCPINSQDFDMADLAKQVTSQRKALGDNAADKLAKSLGFNSVYHAANISSRMKRTLQYSIEIAALRMGNFGFLMSPSAIFNVPGEDQLNKLATDFGFIVCQANGSWNTLPSDAAFDYGCYEADTSYFDRGQAEFICRMMNEMLIETTD